MAFTAYAWEQRVEKYDVLSGTSKTESRCIQRFTRRLSVSITPYTAKSTTDAGNVLQTQSHLVKIVGWVSRQF
jgi:hypothetical protein